ncbi:hypothetical protein [Amycolatopsis orientalis]|uniref:hypothetical protein n=1 Tax=Amycolatopsis orientalis TaxID=31958 RepID=UPI0003A8D2E8|nr:hypothetical protein [Amycolatopsis orientalis]
MNSRHRPHWSGPRPKQSPKFTRAGRLAEHEQARGRSGSPASSQHCIQRRNTIRSVLTRTVRVTQRRALAKLHDSIRELVLAETLLA